MNKTTIKIYKVFFMKYTNYINDTFCLFLCLKKDFEKTKQKQISGIVQNKYKLYFSLSLLLHNYKDLGE
ncbi:hypothetical protein PFMC_03278 [Plasmodium falciparum CAMP/Malaysia]|uniref:Uncharacterized protein n=1 Tax=Plasmodium falciparum (isolate Camp / Malaysia) TaxID=5835 RepID=A0A024X4W5_PLAFC|nr:hypothetical protein PFMC_03278 [Plasmodium falciparum CAMP/Malaysia]